MTENDDLARIRATADEIVNRADSDPEFHARLQQDPIAVLTQEGLSEDYAHTFATEFTLLDTAGFQKCTNFGMTCFFVNWTIVDGTGPCKSLWSLLKDPLV